jgi:hypothetical protein
VIAVTYADSNYSNSAEDKRVELSKLGFEHRHFDEEFLRRSGFYNEHSNVMGKLPNSGCVWKPYIIKLVMEQSAENEIVVYTDCGDVLLDGIQSVIKDHMSNKNFFFVETPHNHRVYTKKYLFKAMDCMSDKYLNANQLDAGLVGFRVLPETIEFVNSWEQLCYNPDFILDYTIGDEWDDLIRHSRDQSILTNLQLLYNIPTMHVLNLINRFARFNVRSN